jgi:hypothetical protein
MLNHGMCDRKLNTDAFLKSPFHPVFVIPAESGSDGSMIFYEFVNNGHRKNMFKQQRTCPCHSITDH